jgi:hypothetical protein
MRNSLVMVLAFVAGCGGDDDCCTVDARVFMDGALPATHRHYVIDRELMPTTNTQAREFGLDLNGDATIDNQLGMVISTLVGMGLTAQIDTDKMIDTGAAIMLVDLGTDDLGTEPTATFTIYQGANPVPAACASSQDITCRKHLTGSASFSIKTGAPVDPPLTGSIVNSKLTAGPGHLTIQFTLIGSAPITVALIGARAELTTTTTAMGKLGGAISKTDLDTKVLPAIRDTFDVAVKRDCTMLTSPPSCGCAADTTGKTLLGLFDTSPSDCNITLTEVQTNSLFQSLLAPDVTVEGTQALSFGVAVHVVGAIYTAP